MIDSCVSSGLKNVSAPLLKSPGRITGILLITDGSNDASITIHDSDKLAEGTILFKGTISGPSNFGGATFEIPVRAKRGIYARLEGTGASYVIYYLE